MGFLLYLTEIVKNSPDLLNSAVGGVVGPVEYRELGGVDFGG